MPPRLANNPTAFGVGVRLRDGKGSLSPVRNMLESLAE